MPSVKSSPRRKSDKVWRDAIMVAVNREIEVAEGKPTRALALLAETLVDRATEGDVQALKEIGDRIDGKPAQTLRGDSDSPLEIKTIRRVIVDDPGHSDS